MALDTAGQGTWLPPFISTSHGTQSGRLTRGHAARHYIPFMMIHRLLHISLDIVLDHDEVQRTLRGGNLSRISYADMASRGWLDPDQAANPQLWAWLSGNALRPSL